MKAERIDVLDVAVDAPHGPITAFDEQLVRAICAFEHLDAIVELRRLGFELLACRCELEIVEGRLRSRLSITFMDSIDGGGGTRWE